MANTNRGHSPNRKKRRGKRSYAIVGEGKCEKTYFDRIKRHLSLHEVDIEEPGNSSFNHIIKKSEDLAKDYDMVFALIDLDYIVNKGLTEQFQNRINNITNNKRGKIQVIESNPCFEIWLYLHFKYSAKLYDRCEELEKDLKNIDPIMKNYEKSKVHELVKDIVPNIDDAMANAKRLTEVYDNQSSYHHPKTDLHILFQELEKHVR